MFFREREITIIQKKYPFLKQGRITEVSLWKCNFYKQLHFRICEQWRGKSYSLKDVGWDSKGSNSTGTQMSPSSFRCRPPAPKNLGKPEDLQQNIKSPQTLGLTPCMNKSVFICRHTQGPFRMPPEMTPLEGHLGCLDIHFYSTDAGNPVINYNL